MPTGIASEPSVEVHVVSDVICPWCYVANRHFEAAKAQLDGELAITVAWRPFELNPDMPRAGMDRRDYRSAKFGSWARSQALDRQVADVAVKAGLTMRHDLIERTPNTFDAHRLIWLAQQHALEDAMVEDLFFAYFVAGRDVGDPAVLVDIAADVGIDRKTADDLLAGDRGSAEVRGAIGDAVHHGIQGVPTFVLNGEPAFSGAQRPKLMMEALRRAAMAHA